MRWIAPLVVVAAAGLLAAAAEPRPIADRFAPARDKMVRDELVAGGIRDPRVLDAVRATPRHEFVPAAHRQLAYVDMALPIGAAQTISGPFVVAYMTERLDPQPTDRVLEIGTGSGYQAAVLAPLVAEVYSIEIEPTLAAKAARTLARLGYRNVETKLGDGFVGWPEHAPFDKIIVTCSPEDVPQPLVDQLAEGGRMVIPVGERFDQELVLLIKREGTLEREALVPTLFVPMTGTAEDARRVLPDGARPAIRNGGFEETLADETLPAAWYYGRQAAVATASPPDAGRHLRLHNEQPGRPAQIFQGFAVDGAEVERLRLAAQLRATDVAAGLSPDEQPAFVVQFYDGRRSRSARTRLPLEVDGDGRWVPFTATVAVPTWAREGSVMVGLLGATGTLEVDDVVLESDAR